MEEVLCRIGRAHRGLRGDHSDGGRNGPEPEAERRAEAAAEDGGGRLFCFAMQSAPVRLMWLLVAGARRKIAGRSHCRPGPLAVRSPSRRPWSRPLPALDLAADRPVDVDRSAARYSTASRRMQEAGDVLRCELKPQRCSEGVETEDVQIFVEVAQPRRQRDRFDAGGFRALRQESPARHLRQHRRRGRYRADASSTAATWLRGDWPKAQRPWARSAAHSAATAWSRYLRRQQARRPPRRSELRCRAGRPWPVVACRSEPCRAERDQSRLDRARCGARR